MVCKIGLNFCRYGVIGDGFKNVADDIVQKNVIMDNDYVQRKENSSKKTFNSNVNFYMKHFICDAISCNR